MDSTRPRQTIGATVDARISGSVGLCCRDPGSGLCEQMPSALFNFLPPRRASACQKSYCMVRASGKGRIGASYSHGGAQNAARQPQSSACVSTNATRSRLFSATEQPRRTMQRWKSAEVPPTPAIIVKSSGVIRRAQRVLGPVAPKPERRCLAKDRPCTAHDVGPQLCKRSRPELLRPHCNTLGPSCR